MEILEDDFINSYPDMTDDELDSMETVIGFDYQQPYIDFESQFPGYLSLRKDIRDKEDLWLDMGGDLSEDPDNHFVMELGERTLLNHKAQVKINDTLYMIREDGWVAVLNSDLELLRDIENGVVDVDDPSQIDTNRMVVMSVNFWPFPASGWPTPSNPACLPKRNKRNVNYKTVGDRRIKWVISIRNYPWEKRVLAKVKGYRQKNNGNWKKYRSDLFVQVLGQFTTDAETCDKQNFDHYESKRRKQLTSKVTVPLDETAMVTKNEALGIHTGAGGITYNSSLTW